MESNRRVLYLIIISVSMAFVSMGLASMWPTVVLVKFKNNATNVDINEDEVSVMLSMYPVGFTAGSLVTRFVADTFGRRATILGSAIPVTLGSIIAAFALKGWLLYITAFTWNCGTGMLSTVIGLYVAEIADKDTRGRLSLITAFMFKFGNLLMTIAGPFMSYEALNYAMVGIPLFYVMVSWWIPETPYYCLKQRDVHGAMKSLKKLREYGDETALEEELTALQTDVHKEMNHSSTVKELFTGKQYRKAIIIATGLKLTQMLTGGVILKQYLSWIVQDTKLSMDINIVFLIYGGISFVVGLMSSILVDKVSRRTLLIYSYSGTGFFLALVGLYFFLQDVIHINPTTLTSISFLPLLGIIMSNVISTLGFNSLIFLIPSEIFPLNVKAIAMTSLNIFGAALGFILALGYQKVKYYSGSCSVFWIFAAFGVGGALFSYYVVTETKGKSLRDIQVDLQGDAYEAVGLRDIENHNIVDKKNECNKC